MHFHELDLNLLVALDALLTEKNVTRAGKRIHLSQSATSNVLARLRRYFNNDLLVPTGRMLVLTPLAQSLVQPVRDVLLQIQHTVAAKADFAPSTSTRRFSLLASDYMTAVLMPRVLVEAARQAPGVTFDLAVPNERASELLDEGQVDFLIVPTVYALEGHPRETLFEDTHSCIVWDKNPLVGGTLSRKQYFELGQVVVRFGHRLTFVEEWFGANYGKMRKVEVVAPNFEAACRLVVGTNRVATVLTRMARLCAVSMPIRLLDHPFNVPSLVEMVQWHKYQDKDGGTIWLRRLLRESARSLEPPLKSLTKTIPSGRRGGLRKHAS